MTVSSDADETKDPLLVSVSWLAGVFFAFKNNHLSCFSSREHMVAAAGLVTINHFNGSQIDAVTAVNLKITSVLETDCSDEKFLGQYAKGFSKMIVSKRRALTESAQLKFIERSIPSIYKEIWNASNNAKTNNYSDDILECANDFVSAHNCDALVIKKYLDSFFDPQSRKNLNETTKKTGCFGCLIFALPLFFGVFWLLFP